MLKFARFFVFLPLLSACVATVDSRLNSVRENYMENANTDTTNIESLDNLELLLTADALFHNGDLTNADKTYEVFNKKNKDIKGGSFSREAVGLLLGANANDYRPLMMDSLFVSYYQLWAALAENRTNDARVIINQSYARQQEMSREYQKLIEENEQNADNDFVKKIQNENSVWNAYRDIMNPGLMYLSGIYFLNNGEFSDAELYLKRASGMMPENKFIATDVKLAAEKHAPQNTVWIFIEDGFAPKLVEKRAHVPIPVKNGTVIATLSVSDAKPIALSESPVNNAQNLADVDAMFMTEYNEYRINEALRAYTSALSRVALQSVAYNSKSDSSALVGFMSTVYSELTNIADTRTWATLPKKISVLRATNNGLIELKSGDKLVQEISVPTDGNYLIYLRRANNKTDIKTIKLK